MSEGNNSVIDFSQELKNYAGEPLFNMVAKEDGKQEAVNVTLREICCGALVRLQQGDRDANDLMAKMRREDIASRIYNEDKPDLDPTEIATIIELVGKANEPLVAGPALRALGKKLR